MRENRVVEINKNVDDRYDVVESVRNRIIRQRSRDRRRVDVQEERASASSRMRLYGHGRSVFS